MGVVKILPSASLQVSPTTAGSHVTSSIHTTAVRWHNTVTIVVVLPGHQTLSYSPIVEDWMELIVSLERLIQRHHSKRELSSQSSEVSGSVSQLSLTDVASHRHQHGHQHDHLHGQLHGRSVGNKSQAALINNTIPGVTGATLVDLGTNATLTTCDQNTSVAVDTTGAVSPISQRTNQTSEPSATASPLAQSQEPQPPLEGANAEAENPGDLPTDNSAESQASRGYSGAGSASVIAADTGTRAMSQQHFSTAERVWHPGMSNLSLWAMTYVFWILHFIILHC